MPFTPVQALQLFHGVESPVNYLSPNPHREILDDDDWTQIRDFASSVITQTRDRKREAALILRKITVGSKVPTKVNSEDGATLIFVEGFDPAIAQGFGSMSPYWEYLTAADSKQYVPRLEMERTDKVGLVLHRHLTWMEPDGEIEHANPNNLPGNIGTWINDSHHAIYQGDAIFVLNASVSLRVAGAHAATLRLVRLADVPGTSERRDTHWVDSTNPDQSAAFRFVLGDLLNHIDSNSPPVLYLGRRPVVNRPKAMGADVSDFVLEKLWPGIMIGVVEDFVVAPGDNVRNKPSLTIKGVSGEPNGVIRVQRAGAKQSEWTPHDPRKRLEVGDAFYVVNATLKMTVNNASVAYIRTAGVDKKRIPACHGRAC